MNIDLSTTTVDLSTLPIGVLVGLGVVLLVEVGLDVVALVDLYRRPVERVALGNKWVWVAIIVLVNLLGAVLYLLLGRKPLPPADEASRTQPHTKTNIADVLYGSGPGDDSNQP